MQNWYESRVPGKAKGSVNALIAGTAGWTRTTDLLIHSQALQLCTRADVSASRPCT